MHDLETLRNGGYKGKGLTELKLSCRLNAIPAEIFELGDTLKHLDLSHTGLQALPQVDADGKPLFGEKWLPHLESLSLANCKFAKQPALRMLLKLQHLDLSNNALDTVHESPLPPNLHILNLFHNRIREIQPLTDLSRLTTLNLTSNRLQAIPDSIATLPKLTTLRLSCNLITALPPWLFSLPHLAYLSFSDNPISSIPPTTTTTTTTPSSVQRIPWSALTPITTLHASPHSTVALARWEHNPDFIEDVIIKLFHAHLTPTGTAANEIAIATRVASHEGLSFTVGKITEHPEEDVFDDAPLDAPGLYQGGIVMSVLEPESYVPLAKMTDDMEMSGECAMRMLSCLAGAMALLHRDGILHGALDEGNVLVSREMEHAVVGDFGAATVYGEIGEGEVEKVEVAAFARVIERVRALVGDDRPEGARWKAWMGNLAEVCRGPLEQRLGFEDMRDEIEHMLGFGRMMRLGGGPGREGLVEGPEGDAVAGEEMSAGRLLAEAMEREAREGGQ